MERLEKDKENIIKMYESKSISDIAKLFHTSSKTINKLFQKWNIPKKKRIVLISIRDIIPEIRF